MNRLITSRLAAKSGTRQVEVSLRADVVADTASNAVHGVWQELLDLIAHPPADWFHVHTQARGILRRLLPTVIDQTNAGLVKLASWGHQTAAANLAHTLPLPYLRALAPVPVETLHRESRLYAPDGGWLADQLLLEAGPLAPGNIRLTIGKDGQLQAVDAGQPLREPSRQDMSEAQQRNLFQSFLFPPPSEARIYDMLNRPRQGVPWFTALARATSLASPDTLATILTSGIAAGRTQREIAADLMPAVDGVRTSARRIARTEGLRIAHAFQMEAHAQADDVIAGYQIHAVLDLVTRPAHRHRNGQVWLKTDPEPMQQKLEMEGPTLPDGYNCRCWLGPVLKPLSHVTDDPTRQAIFSNARDQLIPDPAVYSDWFADADERRRSIAVGSRRLRIVSDILNTPAPDYAAFVDPKSGSLLSLAELRGESPVVRAERMAKVRAVIADQRKQIEQVATFGWGQPPEPPQPTIQVIKSPSGPPI